MKKLIALKPFPYGGLNLVKGDVFEATDADAKAFLIVQQAREIGGEPYDTRALNPVPTRRRVKRVRKAAEA